MNSNGKTGCWYGVMQSNLIHKYFRYLPWLLVPLAVCALIYFTGKFTSDSETLKQENYVSRTIEIHALALRGAAAKFSYLPFTIALHPEITGILRAPHNTAAKQRANVYLEDVSRRAGSDALYVMDTAGKALVASNWNTPQSFVNQDYSNRPYVIDALAGQSGMFYGVGKTTGEPGLFISAPVRVDGSVIGLVAVKVDLRRLQETWALAPDPIVVSDAKGIFFLGSVPSWMYRTNREIEREDLDWLRKHEVYGKKSEFEKIRWSSESLNGSAYRLHTTIEGNNKSYLAVSEPLPEFGWTLTVTTDYASVVSARNRGWMISSLAASLLVLAGLYWRLGRRQFAYLEELVNARTQDLNEAHAFRKAMEDSLLVGMRARNLDGKIIYVNPALCDMTGFSAEELIGRLPPYPYWHPQDMEKHWQDNYAAMSGRAALTGFESRIRHRDGHDVYTMIYTAPLIDVAGKHTGWMSSVVDITAQKQLEIRQRQQDEQLQHVQRREIMSEMASTLAHEVSQPLTAIGANTSAAKLFAEQGDIQQLLVTLDKISQQKSRATEIVKAIKDHARKKTLGAESCDINRIVQSVIAFLRPEVQRRKANIIHHPGDGIPVIQGDRVLLEQVLSNLILNSLQAMQDITGNERVVDIITSRSGNEVEVKVCDRGTGIPVEIGDQLFKNFVTTKEKGLGIGLSICRTIIEQHGGRLVFENRPTGGTIFQFVLPCNPTRHPV